MELTSFQRKRPSTANDSALLWRVSSWQSRSASLGCLNQESRTRAQKLPFQTALMRKQRKHHCWQNGPDHDSRKLSYKAQLECA
ncbi:hypothetical protein ZEAMMB73_Zm00001d050425 [Zea mays]|uniref:Uncharacterized protein n=1 Tax=Zea mays TaxID=4577 RepID=A0A1D6Q1L4_MAIZE|nr:hypothetical protein ZEAMMB73_Zm00001d050425 [Zea mays]